MSKRRASSKGIAMAKAAGVYKGRPASIDAAHVRAMKEQGSGASEIAKALKIGRASVYRVLLGRTRQARASPRSAPGAFSFLIGSGG
jgi:DNA invertase Pin-like site-specific DNA recombinase